VSSRRVGCQNSVTASNSAFARALFLFSSIWAPVTVRRSSWCRLSMCWCVAFSNWSCCGSIRGATRARDRGATSRTWGVAAAGESPSTWRRRPCLPCRGESDPSPARLEHLLGETRDAVGLASPAHRQALDVSASTPRPATHRLRDPRPDRASRPREPTMGLPAHPR
jgi:hypothetical protein